MTPKDKAKELYIKCMDLIPDIDYSSGVSYEYNYPVKLSKMFALIAVDELIENQNGMQDFLWKEIGYLIPSPTYWQEVKQEIDKL